MPREKCLMMLHNGNIATIEQVSLQFLFIKKCLKFYPTLQELLFHHRSAEDLFYCV